MEIDKSFTKGLVTLDWAMRPKTQTAYNLWDGNAADF